MPALSALPVQARRVIAAWAWMAKSYTLYVDPAFQGRGTGRALLHAAFSVMQTRNDRACVIWSHARNNACFFYEAMGGKRVAERTTGIMGEPTPEVAFGWKRLHVGDKVLRP